MIVVMSANATEEHLKITVGHIEDLGYRAHILRGVERNVIACIGDERGKPQLLGLEVLDGVDKVMPVLAPYKLAARVKGVSRQPVPVSVNCVFGENNFCIIAGPCSVESEEQIMQAAKIVRAAGANALRGGAYKPRSSTYAFQGMGEEGLKLLALAKQETGLPIVTELMDVQQLEVVLRYADVIQVGARNMQNFSLLRELGKIRNPVLLKRGLSATVEELLMSAEYILAEGNPNVILCERGIRTYETATRNTLDLNAIPVLLERTHLPVIVDPSHGTGVARYVSPMTKAALACGADGAIIEVHPDPANALSDGNQSLDSAAFAQLMTELKPLAEAMKKEMSVKHTAR
ncbi:MAG: 3-deoxy-7-phosphoheptulonate synthase [Deltaproteobacteria bacterium]|nr:3-deoxy-7-phosphoheptulonate synthase [Deltaproteobacteria bacterium]